LAATDTIAHLLTWTLAELLKNPICLQKLREEIDFKVNDINNMNFDKIN